MLMGSSLDDMALGLEQVNQGLSQLGNRVGLMNEQKLRVLQENHGESVRYLREYRENFKRISSEYQLQITTTQ